MSHIAIIWPAFPYRWGIAHHTNRLINTLIESGNQVSLFTFSRMYPRVLYPGKGQCEPDGTKNPLSKSPNVTIFQILDTLNPLSWYRTARTIVWQKPDVLIIKYWHPFFVLVFTAIAWYVRRKDIKIVCIIENLLPHERHFGDVWLVKRFFSQVDRAVTQSEIVHNQYIALFSEIPETMIPHPVYDQFWPPVPRDDACEKLDLPKEKTILLFFGFIRYYKGLDILLSIMPELITKNPNIHLVIAGECFGSFDRYQEIINRGKLQKYITLRQNYIPSSDIPAYFWACDLLVMPYRHMTNSGIENIGHIYATRSLLTVWATPEELRNSIFNALTLSPVHEKSGLSWEEYGQSLIQFLS